MGDADTEVETVRNRGEATVSSSRGKQRVRELERRKVWAGGGNEGWWCGGYRGPLT